MAEYPISVPRSKYRRHDLAKLRRAADRDRLAERLEKYVNDKVAESKQEIVWFDYRMIAIELHLDAKRVEQVLGEIDGGDNGLFVRKIPTP